MNAVWKLDGLQARLAQPNLSAVVHLSRPDLGLTEVAFQGRSLPFHALLAVDLPEVAFHPQSLSEHWVRGNDLVAVYEPVAERPTRVEVYWRWHGPAGDDVAAAQCTLIELQVSVQTQLLDSHPEVACSTVASGANVSRLGDDDAWRNLAAVGAAPFTPPADRGGTLWQWPARGVAYAELVFPADFRVDRMSPEPGERWRLEHRLFPEFLEKGVILRSRIRGLFCPAADGESTARAAHDAFAASPLPLTT